MSDIEIPDEAVDAAARIHSGPGWWEHAVDDNTQAGLVEGYRRDARASLEAAYPSIRCQVLESVVEDVAKIGVGNEGWAILSDSDREGRLRNARVILGLVEDATICPDCGSKGKYEGRILLNGRGYYDCTSESCDTRWQDGNEKPSTKGHAVVRASEGEGS